MSLNKCEPEEYAIFGIIDVVRSYFIDLAADHESFTEEYQVFSRVSKALREALDLLDDE